MFGKILKEISSLQCFSSFVRASIASYISWSALHCISICLSGTESQSNGYCSDSYTQTETKNIISLLV